MDVAPDDDDSYTSQYKETFLKCVEQCDGARYSGAAQDGLKSNN
jgi:hypothetical protein